MLAYIGRGRNPPPDGGYPGFNTAEGQNALLSLDTSTGFANTALGSLSLQSTVDASFNTGVGAGGHFLSTPQTKILPSALPRSYSILPASKTPPLGWTPF